MADQRHPEFFQILDSELGQDFGIDRVINKRSLILREAEPAQPFAEFHVPVQAVVN